MKVKQLIAALQQCHPDSDVLFNVDFDAEGDVIIVENEIKWKLDRGEVNPVGVVYLHNTRKGFKNDTPLLEGTFYIT